MSHLLLLLIIHFDLYLSIFISLFLQLSVLNQLKPLRGDQHHRSLTEPTEYRFDS